MAVLGIPEIKFADIAKRVIKQKLNASQELLIEDTDIVLDPTDTISILGQKSSGKSYFMSSIADMFPKSIIYDLHWERTVKGNKNTHSVKALNLGNKWKIVHTPGDLDRMIMKKQSHIIIHPAPLSQERSKDDLVAEFDKFSEVVWNWGNYTFFIDEIDAVNDHFHITPFFHNLMEYSKHKNIGIVVGTRRLQHINPRIPRLSDTLIIFRVSGKDAKYVFEFLIEPEEAESKTSFFNDIKRQLTHLPDREFYTFDGKELIQYGALNYEL